VSYPDIRRKFSVPLDSVILQKKCLKAAFYAIHEEKAMRMR
jgi:hypothetical protein